MEEKYYQVIIDNESPDRTVFSCLKGEELKICCDYKKDNELPDWIECSNMLGKKGWVAKQYLEISDGKGKMLCDYSAKELNVKSGEKISVIKIQNGWAWSKKSSGDCGWVPLRNIQKL